MDTVKLTIRPREETGKGPNRRLRAEGSVPAVVYSKGQEAVALSIDAAALKGAVAGGSNVVLELEYEGGKSRKKHFAVVKEFQRHPTRNMLLHVDLHEVDLKQEIEATVRIELVGTPAGAQEDGVLDHSHWEVTVRALPTEVPAHIELDVSALNIGDSLRVSDLTAPEGVAILDDPETTVVSVHPPRMEIVEEVEGEEGLEGAVGDGAEADEGAEAAEGDAPKE